MSIGRKLPPSLRSVGRKLSNFWIILCAAFPCALLLVGHPSSSSKCAKPYSVCLWHPPGLATCFSVRLGRIAGRAVIVLFASATALAITREPCMSLARQPNICASRTSPDRHMAHPWRSPLRTCLPLSAKRSDRAADRQGQETCPSRYAVFSTNPVFS